MQTSIQAPLLPQLTELLQVTPSQLQTPASKKGRGADRLPRFVRAKPEQVSGEVTPHRIAICEALFSYGVMTSDQVRELLFATNTTANQTRRKLAWLFHTEHIYRKEMLLPDGRGGYKKDV